MVTYHKSCALSLVILFSIIFVGCHQTLPTLNNPTPEWTRLLVETNTPLPTATLRPSPTFTSTGTVTPTVTNTPTITLTPNPPTETRLPTLISETAQALVLDLLNNNAGCRLPCWWGMIPGESTINTIDDYLLTFSPRTAEFRWLHRKCYTFYTPDPNKKISQCYIFRDDNLNMIEITFGKLSYYSISELLSEYGPPGEVWISTFSTVYSGTIPFYFILFYPDQGILAFYESINATINGNYIQKCFDKDHAWGMVLWSAEDKKTLQEAADEKVEIGYGQANVIYHPIETATNLNVNTFYSIFKEQYPVKCLLTPINLWPGQYQ